MTGCFFAALAFGLLWAPSNAGAFGADRPHIELLETGAPADCLTRTCPTASR